MSDINSEMDKIAANQDFKIAAGELYDSGS